MSSPRLLGFRHVRGDIVVDTGLRIGGSQDTMEISGLDNPIIRNPANGEPYIPGSSLKGKMRSLAEWYLGELPDRGEVIHPQLTSRTARVFGIPARDPSKEHDERKKAALQAGPTRLIVRDAHLAEASRQRYLSGLPLTEVKSENSINRLTAVANPRPMERVLPGVIFTLNLVYRIFDIGDDGRTDIENFDAVLLPALALVEADALGGGSSRGNGKVHFDRLQCNNETIQLPALSFLSHIPGDA